jgi:hypothetical protein
MLFGSSWTKGRSGADDDTKDSGKQVPLSGNEEEWFDLKEEETVVVVTAEATSSKPSVMDPSFEVVGNPEEEESENKQVRKDDVPPEVRPLPASRQDQVFEAVERMLAKHNGRIANEKWRTILVLLLCSVVAKRILFLDTKREQEEDLMIPVPIVLVDEKPSPVYEAYIMMSPHQHHADSATKPIAKPYVGVQNNHYPYPAERSMSMKQGSLEDTQVAEPPKEKPIGNTVRASTTIHVSTSQSQRPSKPVAALIHEFGAMKAGNEAGNQTELSLSSSSFVDPRPRPSPAHEEQDHSPHDDIIRSLSKRIAELQNKNEEYMERLTRMAMDTSGWRSRAVSCDQELNQVKMEHQALLAKQKLSSQAASIIPIPTVLTEAWNNHRKNGKEPMGTKAISDSNMLNASSIPHMGHVAPPEERSLRPVGPTALIPSPA